MTYTGSTAPIHSKKVCVVYDATSGQIRHRHAVTTFVGGREPTEAQIEADALHVLLSLPNPPGGVLHVLHVPHDAMQPGKRYRVDTNKKQLVVRE
jgi:hypothetical protein